MNYSLFRYKYKIHMFLNVGKNYCLKMKGMMNDERWMDIQLYYLHKEN